MIAIQSMQRFTLLLVIMYALPSAVFSQDKPGAAPKRPPAPVTVVPVTEKQVARQVTLVGSVEAVATSIVAAEVGGVVAAFPTQEGRRVRKGWTEHPGAMATTASLLEYCRGTKTGFIARDNRSRISLAYGSVSPMVTRSLVKARSGSTWRAASPTSA